MFAQDHQLQVCTEPFQTRIKIKFKSQISCGFVFFQQQLSQMLLSVLPSGEKGGKTTPAARAANTEPLHILPFGAARGVRDGGSRNWTLQPPAPLAPRLAAPARGRMRWLTSRFACLRTASSVYRPTRRLCEAEAAAAGGGCGKGVLRCSQSPESPDLFILLWLPQPKPRGWTLHGDTWSAPA